MYVRVCVRVCACVHVWVDVRAWECHFVVVSTCIMFRCGCVRAWQWVFMTEYMR